METPYIEQLKSKEWKRKRSHILSRDKYHCFQCGSFGIMGKCSYIRLCSKKYLWNYIKDKHISKMLEDHLFEQSNAEMEKLKLEDVDIITDWEKYPIRKFYMVNLYPIVTWSMITGPVHYVFGHNISDLHDFKEGYFHIDGLSAHLLECENNLNDYNICDSSIGVYLQTSRFNGCDYYSISHGNKSLILCDKDVKLPFLDVHHKLYIVNRKAWEYEDDNLISLCRACHEKEHVEHRVHLYDENNQPLHELRTCDKCNGTGYLPEYDYFESGFCFKCDGRGVLLNI